MSSIFLQCTIFPKTHFATAFFGYHAALRPLDMGPARPQRMRNAEEIVLPINAVREFLRLESSAGIVLIGAAVAAELWANSPFAFGYFEVINNLGLKGDLAPGNIRDLFDDIVPGGKLITKAKGVQFFLLFSEGIE